MNKSMWVNQSVKSENRNLINESGVSSHCRSNYKAKKCNNTAVLIRSRCLFQQLQTWFMFYQLTTQFAHLSNVLNITAQKRTEQIQIKKEYTCQHIIQMSLYQEKTPE